MPRYDFISTDGHVEEHVVSIADLDYYTSWMKRLGYSRVLNVPNVIVYPTYTEAVAESTAIADRGVPNSGRGIG